MATNITQVNISSVTIIIQQSTESAWKEIIESKYNMVFKELVSGYNTRGLFSQTLHLTNEGENLGTGAITLCPQKHKMHIQGTCSSYQMWIVETMSDHKLLPIHQRGLFWKNISCHKNGQNKHPDLPRGEKNILDQKFENKYPTKTYK